MADDGAKSGDGQWTRRDARLGLLFLVTGVLVTGHGYAAMRNGMPPFLWATAWLLGPAMLLLGGNAVWRALRAGQPRTDDSAA